MDTELKSILESLDKDIFTEDTVATISNFVEEAVNKKTSARVTLEVESALKEKDAEFTEKLKQYAEATDKDHTAKAAKVVKYLNEDFTSKLKAVVEKYQTALKSVAKKQQTSLVESVNDFLDAYIEKNLPRQQIQEAAKIKYIETVLNEARQVLSVDPSLVKENIKSALKDGSKQMQSLVKENSEMKQRIAIDNRNKLLQEKTSNLPIEKARWVRSRLNDKSTEFIKENFQFVVEMYDRNEQKARKSALQPTKPVIVDRPAMVGEYVKSHTEIPQTIQTESVKPEMAMYMEGMSYKR